MRKPILALMATFTGQPALADAAGMCLIMAGTTEEQCTCATEALASEIGAEEAALYDATSTRYRANMSAGQSRGDAWDAALNETASENGFSASDLLRRMNEAGKAHRNAIKSCS